MSLYDAIDGKAHRRRARVQPIFIFFDEQKVIWGSLLVTFFHKILH